MTGINFRHNKFYVYTHSANGVVFYVGKGINGRAFVWRDNEKWLECVAENDGVAEVDIVKYFDREDDAKDFERCLIRELAPEANGTYVIEKDNKEKFVLKDISHSGGSTVYETPPVDLYLDNDMHKSVIDVVQKLRIDKDGFGDVYITRLLMCIGARYITDNIKYDLDEIERLLGTVRKKKYERN